MMRAGALDREIAIERFTETGRNAFNEPIMEWAVLASLPASMEQPGGREFFAAQEVQASRRVVFRTRYVAGVKATDRVMFEGSEHDVQEVREIGRRRGLELHTVAGAD